MLEIMPGLRASFLSRTNELRASAKRLFSGAACLINARLQQSDFAHATANFISKRIERHHERSHSPAFQRAAPEYYPPHRPAVWLPDDLSVDRLGGGGGADFTAHLAGNSKPDSFARVRGVDPRRHHHCRSGVP